MKKSHLFTPGPTLVPGDVALAGAKDMIHHRTDQFKAIYLQCYSDGFIVEQAGGGMGGHWAGGGAAAPAPTVTVRNPVDKEVFAAYLDDEGQRYDYRVNADASFGEIHKGDMLTLSETPGHVRVLGKDESGLLVGIAMEDLEADLARVQICLVGGGNVLGDGHDSPGPAIVRSLTETLDGVGLAPVAEDIGGTRRRSCTLDVAHGCVYYTVGDSTQTLLWKAEGTARVTPSTSVDARRPNTGGRT